MTAAWPSTYRLATTTTTTTNSHCDLILNLNLNLVSSTQRLGNH